MVSPGEAGYAPRAQTAEALSHSSSHPIAAAVHGQWEAGPTMTFRVLIADDQLLVRRVLRLAAQTHETLEVCDHEAETGREAIDLACSKTPDAVILDYEMPEMDGIEALPAIRKALPNGVIVMYSANESPGTGSAALSAGADAYVAKGEQTPAQLLALLAETLSSRDGS